MELCRPVARNLEPSDSRGRTAQVAGPQKCDRSKPRPYGATISIPQGSTGGLGKGGRNTPSYPIKCSAHGHSACCSFPTTAATVGATNTSASWFSAHTRPGGSPSAPLRRLSSSCASM